MDIHVIKVNEAYLQVNCDNSIAQELYDFFSFTAPNAGWLMKKRRGWDGKIHLFQRAHRLMYYGLYEYLKLFAANNNYVIKFDDDVITTNNVSIEDISVILKELQLPFPPRDYQAYSVYRALKHKRNLIISPTGSGKSLVYYILARHLIDQGMKGILVVPTINLCNQMISDFKEYSENNGWEPEDYIHKVYYGQDKVTEKPLVIGTWQSLSLQDTEYFKDVDFIFIDECHLATAKSLKYILESCRNTHIRLGMTGTLDGTLTHKTVLEGLFGPMKKVISTKALMDRKDLAQLNPIRCMKLEYSDADRRMGYKMKYQDEVDWLISHEKRNKFIINLGLSLPGNTLILYQFVEKHGLELFEILKEKRTNSTEIFLVHGLIKPEDREKIRQAINVSKKSLTVASSGTFAVGVNIPNLNNIIFASPSKSKIRILQSIGRGLRKSKTKTEITLYDIFDDLSHNKMNNRTLDHFLHRIDIYDKEQFEYKVFPIQIKE